MYSLIDIILDLDYQTEKKIEKLVRTTGKSEQDIVAELIKEGLKTYRALNEIQAESEGKTGEKHSVPKS